MTARHPRLRFALLVGASAALAAGPPARPAAAPATGPAAAAAAGAAPPAVDAPRLAGDWVGSIVTDEVFGTKVLFPFRLRVPAAGDPELAAPGWGAAPWPVAGLAVAGGDVAFDLAAPHGRRGRFRGAFATDGSLAGVYTWDGSARLFTLRRGPPPGGDDAAAGQAVRGQVPAAPFPYAEEVVRFRGAAGTLEGGLLVPPAASARGVGVVIVGGSGVRCWQGDVPGEPGAEATYWVLADRLAAAGVAVLRVSDRGAGRSEGRKADADLAGLAADAAAAARYLRGRADLRLGSVGLLGHSQGGVVAPLAAVAGPQDVRFLVLLAAPAVPLDELYLEQARRLRGNDPGDARTAAYVPLKRRMYDLAKREDLPADELRPRLLAAAAADPVAGPRADARAQADRLVVPLTRSELRHDPGATLRRVGVPVLLLAAGDDPWVPADVNLPAARRALAAGGNAGVTAREFPGLGHGFRREEPATRETVEPAVLATVVEWVRGRAPAPAP